MNIPVLQKTARFIVYKFIIVISLFPSVAVCQTDSLLTDTVYSIKTKAHVVRADNIGNVFLSEKDVLTKLSPKGDTLFTSSNKLFGDITDIDVSFALKTLIFYQDQNMISILDNTLSQQGDELLLDDFKVYQPMAVCNSYSGNFVWIFNLDNYELLKLNIVDESIEFRSGNLVQQTGMDIEVNDMVEFGNKLYVNNPDYGIMVFDIFGTYIKLIPIKGAEYIQMFQNTIAYKKGGAFYAYSPLTFETTEYLSGNVNWAAIGGANLYVLSGDQLTAFGID